MKKQQDHDISASRFSNSRDKHYNNAKTLLKNRHDCHSLSAQLQFLISIFRYRACEDMLSCQQENINSQMKYELSDREFDCTYLITR